MTFDEDVFIKGLTERPYDAQRFAQFFEPGWLSKPELRPIAAVIFEHTLEKSTPPGIKTIRDILISKDKFIYEQRYKQTLDILEKVTDPADYVSHQIDKATEAAKANCLKALYDSVEFKRDLENHQGGEAIRKLEALASKFEEPDGFRDGTIKDVVDLANANKSDINKLRIPSGIDVIDSWCGGGLRPKQLGIIISATGVGKSQVLAIMAFKMAAREGKRVLHISNELTFEEIGERFLAQLTGKPLSVIMEEKVTDNLGKHWEAGLDSRLRCLEITKEVSMAHIESIIARYEQLYGWSPEVLVIDYMERLRPRAKGYTRDNSSGWFEGIARDIVRLNKQKGLVTWTAAQVNRAGMNSKELSLAHGQGSIKHFQEADAVITMSKKKLPSDVFNLPEEKGDIALHFICQKMRQFGSAGQEALVQANFNHLTLKKDLLSLDYLKTDEDTDGRNSDYENKRRKKPYDSAAGS